MQPQGGFTGELSPDAVRTAIDLALYEKYERTMQPQYLSADNSMFFKDISDSMNGISIIVEEDSNVGEYDAIGEQEEIPNSDTFIANKKTIDSQKYVKQVPVSDEAFRADRIRKREMIGEQLGDRGRQTRDKQAILNTYGDAFAGSVFTTPDGQALASNSHSTVKGTTVDNLETGSLTPDNLWTGVTSLANQLAQDGDAGSYVYAGIGVPFTLYKTAKEIQNSQLIPNSAENNLNIFDTDYGQVEIRASIFLGSTYNTNSNANTSYHLLSNNHKIGRAVFYGMETDLIEPRYSNNDSYQYRSKFHEVSFPASWCGYVGSNGTT